MENHLQVERRLRKTDRHFEILTNCCVFMPDKKSLKHEISSIILSQILYANGKHQETSQKTNCMGKLVNIGFSSKKHQRPMPMKNKGKHNYTCERIQTNLLSTVDYNDDMINWNKRGGLRLVASVFRWRMKRNFKFAAIRFIPISMCMIFFPFLVVFETCFFAIYSAKWGLKTRVFPNLVINHEMLSKYGIIIFDLFSAFSIFRRPTLSPETTDDSANGKLGSINDYFFCDLVNIVSQIFAYALFHSHDRFLCSLYINSGSYHNYF